LRRKLFQGIAYTLLGLIAGKFLVFIFRVVVARYLGSADFGILSGAIAVVTLCGALSTLGMDMGIARFVAFHEKSSEGKGIRSTVIWAWTSVTGIGILWSIGVAIMAPQISRSIIHSEETLTILYVFAVSIPFVAATNLALGVIRGMKAARLLSLATDVMPNLGRLIGAVIVIALGLGIIGIAFSNVSVRILMLPLAVVLVIRSGFTKRFSRATGNSFGRLIRMSLPLTFGVIGKVIRQQADVLIIGALTGPAMMGLYVVAVSLPRFLMLLLNATNRMLMPHVAGLHGSNDLIGAKDLFSVSARWNLVFALPLFAFLMYLGPELVELCFGKEYVTAGNAMRFFLPGLLINASTGSFGEMLQATGRTKLYFYNMLFLTCSQIVFLVTMMPLWGLEGATAGRGTALALTALLGSFMLWRTTGLHPFSKEYGFVMLIWFLTFVVGIFITEWLGPSSNLIAKTLVMLFLSALFIAFVAIWGTDEREVYFRGKLLEKLRV